MFRFGHFSDIHFQYSNYDTDNMRDDLIEKLNTLEPLDAIFITGDIFYRGNKDKKAVEAVKTYISRLSKASRCSMENVYICPGNHDLTRSKARANVLRSIIEDYNDSNSVLSTNDYGPLIYDNICLPLNHLYEEITGVSHPNSIHRFIPLPDVNLVLLNTAVFAGQTYPGQKNPNNALEDTNLFICDEKFRAFQREVESRIDKSKLTIFLGHHSPDCFEKTEKDRLVKYLNKENCDLYLCGHIHAVTTQWVTNTESTALVTCGGPFKDNENYNTPSFVIGNYDPLSRKLSLSLYHFVNSWSLYNQALPPWHDGQWDRPITRLPSLPTKPDSSHQKSDSIKTVIISEIQDTMTDAVSVPRVTARLITYENEKLRKEYLKWIEERKQQNPVNPGSNTNHVNDPVMSTDLQDIGIKQIYPKGQAVKSIEKELKSDMCKEIRVLAFSAEGFTHSYRYELTNYVARGGHLKYLLSKQDTLFIQQAAEMEGRSKDAITKSVNTAIDLISSIYRDAEERSKKKGYTSGTIEVRLFDTEIRNQLILCTDSKNRTSAWMSILIPPRAAVNCQMIEYTDAENCIDYFNTIWNRHEKDTITI